MLLKVQLGQPLVAQGVEVLLLNVPLGHVADVPDQKLHGPVEETAAVGVHELVLFQILLDDLEGLIGGLRLAAAAVGHRGHAVNPVMDEHLVHHGNALCRQQGGVDKGQVLRVFQGRVADAGRSEQLPAVELVPGHAIGELEQVVGHLLGGKGQLTGEVLLFHHPLRRQLPPGIGIKLHRPADGHVCPFPHCGVHHLFQKVRLEPVVRVQEDDVLPRCRLQPGVSGSAGSGVLLPDHLHSVILLGVLGQDGGAFIGGAVVHTDHLEVGIALAQHAVQALPQVLLDVVHRDNHRNFTQSHPLHPLPFFTQALRRLPGGSRALSSLR